MTCNLIEKVNKTIDKYNLLDNVSSICVGVSGGADSVCLLDILNKLSSQYNYSLTVVHVNHNIRGAEAIRDSEFVRNICQNLNVTFNLVSENVPQISAETGESIEECGRRIRYKSFNEIGCDVIAVAHSLSDSIETSLFNISRGTGLKGAAGISAKRDNIIRPLIECTTDEIREYCRVNNLSYVTDSTNLSDDYTRNFFRHQIITKFKDINVRFEDNYKKFLETVNDSDNFIDKCADELIKNSYLNDRFDKLSFIQAHKAVATRALYKILYNASPVTADFVKVRIIYDLLSENRNGSVELNKKLFVSIDEKSFFLHHLNEFKSESYKCNVLNGKCITPFGKYTFHFGNDEFKQKYSFRSLIDADKLSGDLYIRSRVEGDIFTSPIRNNTKRVKKLFNEMKIDRKIRHEIGILCDDYGIVWIENIGTNKRCAVDENTVNFLFVKKD